MMPQLVALFTLNISSFPTFVKRMTHSAIVLARRKFFVISIIVLVLVVASWVLKLFFLYFFHLFFSPWLVFNLACNVPSTKPSALIFLLCSWACKAFTSSTKVSFDRSLVFSKDIIVVSNSFLSDELKQGVLAFFVMSFTQFTHMSFLRKRL